jgi:hypothetical protein
MFSIEMLIKLFLFLVCMGHVDTAKLRGNISETSSKAVEPPAATTKNTATANIVSPHKPMYQV